jgi:hypothetical protein
VKINAVRKARLKRKGAAPPRETLSPAENKGVVKIN